MYVYSAKNAIYEGLRKYFKLMYLLFNSKLKVPLFVNIACT